MRNLDSTNPAMAQPRRFASQAAFLSLAFGLFGVGFASDAASSVPLYKNPVALISFVFVAAAALSFIFPRVCEWDWQAKYFGVAVLHLSSVALIFVAPCLCIVFYSKLSLFVRLLILLFSATAHVMWCGRFLTLYKKIIADEPAQAWLYQEENEAVYYMQKVDKYLIEKRLKFGQMPQDRYILLCIIVALSMLPVMRAVTTAVGLPFIYSFLTVGAFPISLMMVGFATRGWLVFYRYPMHIAKSTGKKVYVDMASKANLTEDLKRNLFLRADRAR